MKATFALIAFLVLILMLFVGLIFYGLVFPIWMLIHCANSTDLSKKAKSLWIIGIVVSWFVGASFYGFFSSKDRRLQWLSGIFFFLFICATALRLLRPDLFKTPLK